MIKGKRGVSSVIATILLILLTMAAVAILAAFVVPLVRESLNESTRCVDYKDYFYFENQYGYNCYNVTNGYNLYAFSIGAKTKSEDIGNEVEGIQLVLKRKDSSEVLVILNTTPTDNKVGGTRMIQSSLPNLIIPNPGEVRTYVQNRSNYLEGMEVYVRLKGGKVCEEKTDSINLVGAYCDPNLVMNVI